MMWFSKRIKEMFSKSLTLTPEDARFFAKDLLRAADEAEKHSCLWPVTLYSKMKDVLHVTIRPFSEHLANEDKELFKDEKTKD